MRLMLKSYLKGQGRIKSKRMRRNTTNCETSYTLRPADKFNCTIILVANTESTPFNVPSDGYHRHKDPNRELNQVSPKIAASETQGGVGINKRHLGSIFFFQWQAVDLPTT
jgi:hypothetical protein